MEGEEDEEYYDGEGEGYEMEDGEEY